MRAFMSIGRAVPAEKAALLSEGIAQAMNCGALVALPSIVCWAAATLLFLTGTLPRSSDLQMNEGPQ